MKMEHRWLAWMAALMLASVLLATPREGTAGQRPYIFIDQQPGAPLFGDPEEPSSAGRITQDTLRWYQFRLSTWFLNSRKPAAIAPAFKKLANAPASVRATKHE